MKPHLPAGSAPRQERTEFYPEQFGLNGLRELIHVRFTDACLPIGDHIHPDAIELCYITKGSQIYATRDSRHRVSAGMVYLSYPNEHHSTDALQQEKDVELYYIIVDTLNDADSFLGLSADDGRRLASQLNGLNRCFYAGMELKRRFDEMIALSRLQPEGFELLLRCHVCLMIHELVLASRSPQPAFTADILKALQYIEEHLTDTPPTVSGMAGHVHLSVPHFKQKFRAQTGLPPAAYQQKRRIELSLELLGTGASVTQTAHTLGFSSSQHFASTFRRYVGMTPRDWKKSRPLRPPIEKDM